MGRRLKVIKLPAPTPAMFRSFKEAGGMHPDHAKKGYVPRVAGERLAASYINHYIANGGIVCPQFGGAQVGAARGVDVAHGAQGVGTGSGMKGTSNGTAAAGCSGARRSYAQQAVCGLRTARQQHCLATRS